MAKISSLFSDMEHERTLVVRLPAHGDTVVLDHDPDKNTIAAVKAMVGGRLEPAYRASRYRIL